MDLYQDVFFRSLDVLRGRKNIRRLKFLRTSQYWPLETLAAWQLDRLNELVLHARQASPFHAERLRGVKLPLESLEALRQIPILTKQEIREHHHAIRARGLPRSRYIEARTGGSTGRPMPYYWDKQGKDWDRGIVYRSSEWAGTRLGDRTIEMSGSQYDRAQADKPLNRLAAFLQRWRHCSIAWTSDEVHEDYYRFVERFRPASIRGYASGLDLFARYVLRAHPGAQFPSIRAIITSSENLSREQRARINEAFGNDKVFDHYGSREMYIAAECRERHGYHIHADTRLLEIVDNDGQPCSPGQPGRVVLTDLFNHAFPFLRYEIGDVATLLDDSPCACGVTLPRLASVDGRIADFIVLQDRVLTPPNFAALLGDVPGVRAYQIRQDSPEAVLVLLDTDPEFDPASERFIRDHIESLLAGQASLEIRVGATIPIPESGKRRFVVSSVSEGPPSDGVELAR